MLNKIPVIIDCDPGLDDIVGLLMACSSNRLDVRAVTVVAGNQTVEKVGENALRFLELIGMDIPVSLGFSKPLVRELVIGSDIHGENGICNIELPKTNKTISSLHAIDLMKKIVEESEKKITLIPTGPLTNIAMFILRYPELKDKIEKISLMGGGINGGNRTKAAEFNIYVDPEAADIVFKSGIPITMCGLDVTKRAYLLREDIYRIKDIENNISRFMMGIIGKLPKFKDKNGNIYCPLHDPVAVYAVSNPDMIHTKALHVDIELKGEFTRGATVANMRSRFNKKTNADVAFGINREDFVENIIKSIVNS